MEKNDNRDKRKRRKMGPRGREGRVKNPSSKYWKGGSFKCSDSFNKYAGPDLNRKGFSALIP